MPYSFFVGFDVSKAKLNYCLRHQNRILEQGEVDNKLHCLKPLLAKWQADYDLELDQLLGCAENTGLYTNNLIRLRALTGFHLWVEDAFHLQRCLGRQRDKTDEVDARNIAEYAQRYLDKAKLYELSSQVLDAVGYLRNLRTKLVKFNQQLKTSCQERKAFSLFGELDQKYLEVVARQIKLTKDSIAEVEDHILQLIRRDEELNRKYTIMRSVPGLGKSTGLDVFLETGAFVKVSSARQCASYAGISPHLHQSGTSLKRSPKVGKGSRVLKAALHKSANCMIPHKGLLRDLYKRLRAKGRNFKQAINAVRNKIIRILYACLEKGQLYDKKVHQGLA